mgnify:CR=1 FL=1
MITLDKVKIIKEGRKKKVNNPDQGDLFNQPENNKSEAQQYTDKINKQNKNRPESKRSKRVFPGDKSGAYKAAKSDLEARQGIKKAGGSGDIGYTAPDRASKVAKRTTRADKLGTPDPFTTPSSKKPIRPFGQVGRDKAPEGLFGPGETKGQMTAKRMDTKAFKKTQATSDLLPKSFKDFDKKIKSLKVDVDIERRIQNPRTASVIDAFKKNKRNRRKGGGYNRLAKSLGFKGISRKTVSGVRAPEDLITKVKQSRKLRRSQIIQKDLFGGQSKVVGTRKLKKVSDIRNKSRKPSISGNPEYTSRRQMGADGLDSNAFDGGAGGRTVTGDTPKRKAPEKFTYKPKGDGITPDFGPDVQNYNKLDGKVNQQDRISFNRTQVDDLRKKAKEIDKKNKEILKKAKDASKQNISYDPQVAKQAKTLGRYKKFKSYMKGRSPLRIAKTFAKKNPGKAGLAVAGIIGAGALAYNAFANKGKLKAKDYKAVPYRLASGKKINRKSTNELDRELMDAQRNTLSKKLLNQMSGTGRYQKTASYDFVKKNPIYRKNVEKTVKQRGYRAIMKDGKFQNYSGDPYGILGKKA